MTPRSIVDCIYRTAYRAGFQMALPYWRLRQPQHQGALVAVWAGQRLLFVRQSYRPELSFPGGGVRAGERPQDAARRELVEELGIVFDSERLKPVYETAGIFDGRRDRVFFFELHLAVEPVIKPDNREIVHAQFIDPADIAQLDIVPPVARYLEWRNHRHSETR
jgi:8-oxo-dGTP diphosphatase